jgi:hypothetical protein
VRLIALIRWGFIIAMLSALFLMSCSKSHKMTISQELNPKLASGLDAQLSSLNDSDLARMSVEERTVVLKAMLENMLGVGNREGLRMASKSVSVVTSSKHLVEESPVGGRLREYLAVSPMGSGTWKLSFFERLQGDLDFNHEVKVSDVTPIAQYFGKTVNDTDVDIRARVLHMDRLCDGNGEIGISDLSSLAQNIGSSINNAQAGYSVYFRKGTHDGASWSWMPWTIVKKLDPTLTYREDDSRSVIRALWHWDNFTSTDLPEGFEENPDSNTVEMLGVRAVDDNGVGANEATPLSDMACFPTDDCPPIAVLSAPAAVNVGRAFTLYAVKSKDPDELPGVGIVEYEWDLDGDGIYEISGMNSEQEHIYYSTGTYNVRLRVTDDESDSDVVSQTISVGELNTPPFASITASTTSAKTWEAIDFDASGSVDYDYGDEIVKYEWDFNNDTVYDQDTGTTSAVSHSFGEVGTFTVKVRVTDTHNATDTASVNVQIVSGGAHPPEADLQVSPEGGDEGEGETGLEIELDASGSTDVGEDIEKYEWDWEGDGLIDEETDALTPIIQHVFIAGAYVPSVRITDSEGDMDVASYDDFIIVTGPPAIVKFTATPSAITAGVDSVVFRSEAMDTDGGNQLHYFLDFYGEGEWAPNGLDYEGVIDGNLPPERRVYWREDACSFLGVNSNLHTTLFLSMLKVEDNEGERTCSLPSEVLVTHSVPSDISLTRDPEFPHTVDSSPVNVTFWAHANDADGSIANYEMKYGDTPENPSVYSPVGLFNHAYAKGKYTINLWVYDDDYISCNQQANHKVEYGDGISVSSVRTVSVMGPPACITEKIDDGGFPYHVDGIWNWLGNPSIAIDVNPATGEPAVAYYAAGAPQGRFPSAFFSQRMQGGGWSLPSKVSCLMGEPIGAYVGRQLDLTFDPVLYEEGATESALPYVAATVYTYNPGTSEYDNYGINLYFGYFDASIINWIWTSEAIVDDGSNSWISPIRLVADCDFAREPGAILNQSVNYASFDQSTLMEAVLPRDTWPYVTDVDSSPGLTGITHDYKPYQCGNKDNGRGAAVYVQRVGFQDYLIYEVEDETDRSWNGQKHIIAAVPPSQAYRNVALDYFGDKVGIIWVTNGGDLYFVENVCENWNPSSPELIASGVGCYADFDYEDTAGVQTIAYETSGMPWSIYVKCRFNGDTGWLAPIYVDDQVPGVYDNSYLDMEVHDGYIYIAYSKNRDMYCHIMDYYGGNRID